MFVCGGQTAPHYDPNGRYAAIADVECFRADRAAWQIRELARPPLAKAVHGLGLVAFGHTIFAVGGITDSGRFNGRLWCLDVRASREWTKLSSMPLPRSGFGTAVLHGVLFVVGGWDGAAHLASVLCYSLRAQQWTSTAAMLFPRYALSCASLGGRVYAVGGGTRSASGEVEATAAVERFDPVRQRWEALPNMRHARMCASCVACGGRLVVLGGQDTSKTTLRSIEMFDPDAMTWTDGPPMPEGRTAASACALPN